MSDKCIACQFVKNPVEVRFFGHEMWKMECGIEGKLVVTLNEKLIATKTSLLQIFCCDNLCRKEEFMCYNSM